ELAGAEFVLGLSPAVGLGRVGEPGGEVGFPGEVVGMSAEPVSALGEGGFDGGDPVDGPFGLVEALSVALEVGGGSGPFLVKPVAVLLLGVDPVPGGGDGVVVGAAEAAGPGEHVEVGLVAGEADADLCDVAVEAGDLP